MFCAKCGASAPDGAHFCENCGASLPAPGGVTHRPSPAPAPKGARRAAGSAAARAGRAQDPYKDRIVELRLQIRQLKLYLKQDNQKMSSTRLIYNETEMFVPRGLLKMGAKLVEDARLLGPQQHRQQLQQQIMQMEQELLGLQQQQAQWKLQQQG